MSLKNTPFKMIKEYQRFFFAGSWWIKTGAGSARKVRTTHTRLFGAIDEVQI